MISEVRLPARDRATVAERVERRFEAAAGRVRLEGELWRIAQDLLGRPDLDDLDPAARDVVQRITRAAIAASVEPLIQRFTAELAHGMASLPADARDRLLDADPRGGLGLD